MKQLHFRGFEPYLKLKGKSKKKPTLFSRFEKFGLLLLGAGVVSSLLYLRSTILELRQSNQELRDTAALMEEKRKQLKDYEKQKPDLLKTLAELKELEESVGTSQERVGASLDYIESIKKRLGLSEFSEEDITAINDVLMQIFKMPIEDVSISYNVYEIVFTLFDWVKDNIEYVAGTDDNRGVLSPADVLLYRRGDCDEQTTLLSGMIDSILAGSTRIISTTEDHDGLRHAYLQFYVSDYKTIVDYRTLKAVIIEAIQKHYGVSGSEAEEYAQYGLDLDTVGLWFSLDTTGEFPGDDCKAVSDCKPESIFYHW